MAHQVYFCGDSAANSFAGRLDDKCSMSETDVSEFIRYSRPDLFRRLQQLPASSEETSFELNSRKQRMFIEGVPSNQKARYAYDSTMCVKIYNGCLSTLHSDSEADHLNMLDLQHKWLILQRLLVDESLILQSLNDASLVLFCAHPHCLHNDSKIPPRSLFVTLTSGTTVEKDRNALHYCLECLEHLFGLEPESSDERTDLDPFAALCTPSPGMDAFDSTAEHPLMEVTNRQVNCEPTDLPHNYPSNSKQATLIRWQRDQEIQEILEFVNRYGCRRKKQQERAKSPDLLISRPPNVHPWPERYKKQGRMKADKDKARREMRKSMQLSLRQPGMPTDDEQKILHCYCREEEDDGPMIKCASPLCLIGSFHVRCTGLNGELKPKEKFYCIYCKEGLARTHSPTDSSGEEAVSLISDMEDSDYSFQTQDTPFEDELQPCTNHKDGGNEETVVEMAALDSSPGFVAINGKNEKRANEEMRHETTQSNSQHQSGAEVQSYEHLDTTISDLAPFFYANFSEKSKLSVSSMQADALYAWKMQCPPSKISSLSPTCTMLNSSSEEEYLSVSDDGDNDKDSVFVQKLSEMLTQVTHCA